MAGKGARVCGWLSGWLCVWLCGLSFLAGMGTVLPAAFSQHGWKKATRIGKNHEFVTRLVHLNGSPKSYVPNEIQSKDKSRACAA